MRVYPPAWVPAPCFVAALRWLPRFQVPNWERDSCERGLPLSRRDGLRERSDCKLQVVNGMP